VIYVGRKIMTQQLQELMSDVNVHGQGYVFAFNSKGEFLQHPDPETKAGNARDIEATKTLMEMKTGRHHYVWKGAPKVSFVQYFEPWDWYVCFGMNDRDLMQGVDKSMINAALGSGGAALVLALALIALISRNLMRPLRDVAAKCGRIGQGDYTLRIDYNVPDAIGEAVKAINGMVGEVQDRMNYLSSFRDGISVPMFMVDPETKLVKYVSTELEKLVGHSAEQSMDKLKGFELLNYATAEECKVCKAVLQEVAPKGVVWNNEVTIRNAQGSELTCMASVAPIKDRHGKVEQVVALLLDITEIRRNEQLMAAQQEKLQKLAVEIGEISEQVASAAEELAAQVEQASRGSDLQRQRTTETATSMEEMNASILEVARNSGAAAELADNAKNEAGNGARVVQEATQAIERVRTLAEELQNDMQDLGLKTDNIGQILNVITDIADQTNLLALNAAIEAARAGEAGRGFAVVADEVRKLAEKTMSATKDVGSAVHSIQDSAKKNISSVEEAFQAVDKSTELAERSRESLQSIVGLTEETSDQVRAIATASEEQSAASEEVNTSMEEVNRIASETAEGMIEAARAVSLLAQRAQDLQNLIRDMK
jgi:methyl-accepting chemotaxis protein